MEPRFTYRDMVKLVRNSVYTTVRGYYPSKANHEKMSLYDLMTFAVMAHICFDGVYKKAYKVFIDELKLFPRVRYNKVVERIDRYEELLLECLKLFKLDESRVVDSKPVETKKLIRYGRHKKRGKSSLIKDDEAIGYNMLKGVLRRL